MALNFLLKRSGTASKRPNPASMTLGELDLNYDASTGGIYYKDSAGNVVKVGPCQVSATAPNVSPAGTAGNSAGEFWFDTVNQVLKVWSGSAWLDATSTSDLLPLAGGTMTGDITFAGTQSFPVSGIQPASTTQPGVVQLNDTTSSTSTTEALTANQGKELQDQINALSVASNIIFAGTIDASTGNLVTVTAEGTTAGFTIGDPLPAAASGNDNYFVIVTTPGTMTPPGGSAQECHQGDWFLSDGSTWQFLDVGFNATAATTSTPGVVQLATDLEVQDGLNTDHAVTPSGLQSKVSDSTSTTSSTTLASSTAVKDAYDAGIQGQTDAAAAQATADAAIPDASFTALGDILSGTGAGTYAALALGTDADVLTVDSTCPGGLKWAAGGGGGGSGTVTSITAGTGLTGGTITTTGTIALDTACVVEPADFTAKGQILVGTGSGTYCSLPVGSNGQVLYANSFYGSGVYWGAAPAASTTETLGLTYGLVEGPAPFPSMSCENSSFGYFSMGCNLAGGAFNVAVGNSSAYWMSTGSNNTAVGYTALFSSTAATESSNTALGYQALANTGGSGNVAVGANAGYCVGCNNVGGDNNIAIGFNAACLLESGSQNVVIGSGVQPASVIGSCQLAIGFAAGQCWLSGTSTKAIRPGAGIIDCAGSCGTAGQVLMSNGSNAVCWGAAGGASPATPTVAGTLPGRSAATISSVGCNAMRSLTTGLCNTAAGVNALCSLTNGCFNTAVGFNASCSVNTGISNTSVGHSAGMNTTTGNSNTAIGVNAMFGISTVVTGSHNTALGGSAMFGVTSGSGNIAIGGANAAGTFAPVFGVTTECNRIAMGSTAVTNAYVQVAWTVVSDARDKIVEGGVPHGLGFVNQLEPKAFHFKEDRESTTPHGPLRYGFLAQDILALEGGNGIIIDAEDPDKLRYNGEALVPVLVNAIKELSAKNDELEARLRALEIPG